MNQKENLGLIIKRGRVTIPLTLHELSTKSGISASHLGRIERGERFPSGRVLRKIAGPLGFDEDELFTLAGYLSPRLAGIAEGTPGYGARKLDPYMASVLAEEPADVQRALVSLLTLIKNIAKNMAKENQK